MDPDSITRYITDTFAGIDVVVASGDTFYFTDPDRKLPFATLVTSDAYDDASDLNRPSVFRVNIGVSRDTYRSLFGPRATSSAEDDVDSGYDFTTLDRIMPHPVYGRMFWVCALNPSASTFELVKPLLAEAYERSVRRQSKTRPVADES